DRVGALAGAAPRPHHREPARVRRSLVRTLRHRTQERGALVLGRCGEVTTPAFSFQQESELDDVLAPVRKAAETVAAQLPFVRSMTRRVLNHFDTRSLDIADDVVIAPAEVFTSAERFAADRAMMMRTPHVVAWGGEIAEPGDYTTKDVM